ncbi:MAG: SDR family oxidoreductase [Candidatus Thiodiazotropha sp. (ex Epidulcina cf. delphinae)]|nr:SDR family oxidoreductase [Candidatus Thiodiazotropha sp. (ex Epidulcina cf. delphinae)]
MDVAIIGCGDIGARVALACRERGDPVTGWVSTVEGVSRIEALGIDAVQNNLDRPLNASVPLNARQLYYFVPPPPQGTEDSRVASLIGGFPNASQPERVVYLSTSGVYGECKGAWVDETRPPAPRVDRARRRLDAEHRWRAWSEQSGQELVILRVAGIYGPGKLPLQRLQSGQPMVAEADSPITNRIHTLDLVQICLAAMQRGRAGEVYNVSDGHPGTMTGYFNQVADFLGLPRPPLISLEEARRRLPPGMLSYLAESRRLSNRKMLSELGVALRYPTLEQGLPACV